MKKLTPFATRLILLYLGLMLGISSASATTYYWTGQNSDHTRWGTSTNWSASSTGTTAGAIPNGPNGDIAVFSASNTTNSNAITVAVDSAKSAAELIFQPHQAATDPTVSIGASINGGGLTLGTGASSTLIDVQSGSGAVSLGSNGLTLAVKTATVGSVFTFNNSSASNAALTLSSALAVRIAGAGTGTFAVTGSSTGGTVFNGAISDQSGTQFTALSVASGATATLGAANSFTGATTVNGTLKVNVNGALAGTTEVDVSGGSLVFGSSAVTSGVNSAATISLASGSLVMNGAAQTIGILSLISGENIIDLSGGGLLTLDSLSWTDGATLEIIGWNGSTLYMGDSTHQIILGDAARTEIADHLGDISWTDASVDKGPTFGASSSQISGNQVTPVPEPSTIFTGLALVALLAWSARRPLLDAIRA